MPNKRVEFYKKCIETFLTVREDRKAAYILSEKTKNILGMDSVVPKIAHYKFLKINENVGYRFSYDEYRSQICDNLKEDYLSHIVNLFSLVKGINLRNSQKDNTKNLNRKKLFESERKYFTSEGIEYALQYPQVYISTIDMMVLLEDFSNLEVMFEYTFSGNRYFVEYTETFILLELVEKAKSDEKILLLLLIAMVECTRRSTNVLFGFLLDYNRFREEDAEQFKNIQKITVWLWNLFNQSGTYLMFRESLIHSKMYMNKYDVIYQQIYDDYCKYEQGRIDPRVENFFNEKR